MDDRLLKYAASASPGEPSGVFESLAALVYASDDFTEVYGAVCDAATKLITGCDHASVMLHQGREFVTACSSDDVATQIDSFERELEEGPCVDAIESDGVYIDSDLRNGSPWPRLEKRVLAETPVRGMAGFRLKVSEHKTGALNLFCDQPGGLDQSSIDEAVLLAAFLSVALVAADKRERAETLRDGLQSNREIGKAVGLLMAFHQISDQDAFDMLRKASQDMNVKLVEVAKQVVDHHNSRE